jgi:hypothetical protein
LLNNKNNKKVCDHLNVCQGGTDRMLEVLDAAEGQNVAVAALWIQGCYSDTGFHIVIDRNFVCLWRSHNCNRAFPFCADLLIYEINYRVLKQI